MLEITGLRKAYRGREVLRGVDLEAAPGQVDASEDFAPSVRLA